MQLKRSIGVGLLTFYGVGVMVGAGIYVLVGEVAGIAGAYTPLAFLLAGVIASLSAYSFAELAARIPESAGEAAYVEKAFGARWLAVVVGLGVAAVGLVSAAAILKGGVGYLLAFIDAPRPLLEIVVLAVLGCVAALGVSTSLSVAAGLTIVEIIGLLLVAVAGFAAAPAAVAVSAAEPALSAFDGAALATATLLAFFAFVGFEDMVNIAEETIEPERTMPRAIFAAVALTTALYCLVSTAAVRAVSSEALAANERPLGLVFQAGFGVSDDPIIAIAVMATLNGVLAQLVMASRVLFGLGRRSVWLRWFHVLNPTTRTPIRGVAVGVVCVALLAAAAPIAALAEATSILLLGVFITINAALIVLKRRSPPPPGAPNAPIAVPALALLAAVGLLAFS